ncbi:LOW QUALITY PROTEIN: hypothetical protein HZS_6098 [Henneguya salminicola]|nr:LOW QUALITY PROTEIN: hypothetical protein HZS_6098 [Henneguya salminicola]
MFLLIILLWSMRSKSRDHKQVNTNLEIILSGKSKNLLVHQSYLYRIGRPNIQNNYISWRCHIKICPSTLRTNRDENLIKKNATVHNHAPNPEDLSKRRIISDVRIRARTTTESP